MPNILDTYDQELIEDTGMAIHIVRLRYGGAIVAIALLGDADTGSVADNISGEDYWAHPCNVHPMFPIGIGSSYGEAYEKLIQKMKSIEYSDKWRTWMWDITEAMSRLSYTTADFELPEFPA